MELEEGGREMGGGEGWALFLVSRVALVTESSEERRGAGKFGFGLFAGIPETI